MSYLQGGHQDADVVLVIDVARLDVLGHRQKGCPTPHTHMSLGEGHSGTQLTSTSRVVPHGGRCLTNSHTHICVVEGCETGWT